jgi:hypothetical protein
LEIQRLEPVIRQLRLAGVVGYSLLVMATVLPETMHFSNAVVVPYYLFIPGYSVALLLLQRGTVIDRIFYSVVWSMVIFASLYSIETVVPGSTVIPLNVIIPYLTIIVFVYDHLQGR